eukprot:5614598-Pleurochrysis_carterae.AAC.1
MRCSLPAKANACAQVHIVGEVRWHARAADEAAGASSHAVNTVETTSVPNAFVGVLLRDKRILSCLTVPDAKASVAVVRGDWATRRAHPRRHRRQLRHDGQVSRTLAKGGTRAAHVQHEVGDDLKAVGCVRVNVDCCVRACVRVLARACVLSVRARAREYDRANERVRVRESERAVECASERARERATERASERAND